MIQIKIKDWCLLIKVITQKYSLSLHAPTSWTTRGSVYFHIFTNQHLFIFSFRNEFTVYTLSIREFLLLFFIKGHSLNFNMWYMRWSSIPQHNSTFEKCRNVDHLESSLRYHWEITSLRMYDSNAIILNHIITMKHQFDLLIVKIQLPRILKISAKPNKVIRKQDSLHFIFFEPKEHNIYDIQQRNLISSSTTLNSGPMNFSTDLSTWKRKLTNSSGNKTAYILFRAMEEQIV